MCTSTSCMRIDQAPVEKKDSDGTPSAARSDVYALMPANACMLTYSIWLKEANFTVDLSGMKVGKVLRIVRVVRVVVVGNQTCRRSLKVVMRRQVAFWFVV